MNYFYCFGVFSLNNFLFFSYCAMNTKVPQKILGINLLLFALLYGLVELNKTVIRPALHPGSFLNTLAGCFPNFIAALLISLAPVVAILFRKPVKSRLIVYLCSILIFLILTIEEFKPMWGASTHFDIYDIIASGIGSGLAILLFEFIHHKQSQPSVNNSAL